MSPRLRLAAWCVGVAFMVGGPFYRQALGQPSTILRRWAMYKYYGTDICHVRYTRIDADGDEVPVDRLPALGYPVAREAPRSVRRLEDEEDARRQGRQLCKQLGADDLRMELACARRNRGWVRVEKGEDNLCSTR